MEFQTPHNGPTGQCFLVRHHWPISGPLGPPWWLPDGPFWANRTVLRSRTAPSWAFWPMKTSSYGLKWPDLVQNAPSGWSPQEQYILDPLNVFLGLSKVPKRAFNGHLGAPRGGGGKRSKNGSVTPNQETLASWTNMWCLEPHLVPYKTSGRAKISLLGPSRPPFDYLDHPIDPPKPSQTPLIPFSDLPHNQYHPSSYLTTQ